MRRVAEVAATFALAFLVYLILTAFSGEVGLWSWEELIGGAALSFLVALASSRLLWERGGWRLLNPVRFATFLVYLVGPFLLAMAKANLDVAYRVITGRINPGIVRFNPGLKTDAGRTLLANSITLTPGTLTLEVDDATGDFYVHWINVSNVDPKPEDVCGSFPKWARVVAE
ncbi:MAG: Na+/H+ antiporter subunit E [Candidatus Bipolaricaulota bacterium]|nr:Na+/H+ antiporter subunit E [Candidatus Bipolaricaulota bacterium]MDW8127010.1 Na+/H+ antiporter subunit E [Candidatus Bipolaricaulota bacterium]